MENRKVSIELTVAQWNIVMDGVISLPFSRVAEIVSLMRQQADSQLNEMAESTESQPS